MKERQGMYDQVLRGKGGHRHGGFIPALCKTTCVWERLGVRRAWNSTPQRRVYDYVIYIFFRLGVRRAWNSTPRRVYDYVIYIFFINFYFVKACPRTSWSRKNHNHAKLISMHVLASPACDQKLSYPLSFNYSYNKRKAHSNHHQNGSCFQVCRESQDAKHPWPVYLLDTTKTILTHKYLSPSTSGFTNDQHVRIHYTYTQTRTKTAYAESSILGAR